MEKRRYLQVTSTMMFEYAMHGEDGNGGGYGDLDTIAYARTMDNRDVIVFPVSYECDASAGGTYVKKAHPVTISTLNHLAVAEDNSASELYSFHDPDYKYVESGDFSDWDGDTLKVSQYAKYLRYPTGGDNPTPFRKVSAIGGVRWDSMRLYFVNGYDFSDIYGIYVRISVDREPTRDSSGNVEDPATSVDLCSILITRDIAYRFISYLTSPIMLGNDVYDRYIEVNLPCLYDLIIGNGTTVSGDIQTLLNIKPESMIRLSFSTVSGGDVVADPVKYTIMSLVSGGTVSDKVNLTFTKNMTVNGSVPTETINSDNLGCYIAEVPDKPYLQFYATWRDSALTNEVVWKFNKGIRLYDTSLVRRDSGYVVDEDYTVGHSERKWMAMHEIRLSFCMGSVVVKKETYSMNQIFVDDSDPSVFYYRPYIFDELLGMYIDNIQIVYTMRFVNVDDKVQFVKVASLSLTGNMGKYYALGTNIGKSNMTPFKVYNKTVAGDSVISGSVGGLQAVKYVKEYYRSDDLYEVGTENSDGIRDITLIDTPFNEVFTIKSSSSNDYYDLSGGTYQLVFTDASGSVVKLDPTYSENMNLVIGQLEFYFNSTVIGKLKSLPEDGRKMSIVSCGEGGAQSTVTQFRVNFL